MAKKTLLCMILALGISSVQVAQGQLITGLEQRNSTSPVPVVVTAGLQEGSLVFTDRTHQYREISPFLLGAEYVRIGNNDKTNGIYELDLTLASSATLYLFLDNRLGEGSPGNIDTPPTLGGGVMQWVLDMGFESTYQQIGVDEHAVGYAEGYSTVYSLKVPAGKVTLGAQNDGGTRRMYGIAAWPIKLTADAPMPEQGAVDVPIDQTLGWTPGENAGKHDVYFGTAEADVTNAGRTIPLGVLVSKDQDANTYDPAGSFEFGQTYFWRVDEVAADNSISKGKVWSFEAEPRAYPIAGSSITASASSAQAGFGPENTLNGSGLDDQDGHSTAATDMWQTAANPASPVWIQYAFDRIYKLHEMKVWNYNADLEFLVGFGLKEVTIETSLDGSAWTGLGDFSFNQGDSAAGYQANTTVDFKGAAARFVRLTVKSSFGNKGRYGLSEVRFLYIPTYPRQPDPQSGATGVDTNAVLTWRAGRDAASHELYLSTDPQAVIDGTAPVTPVTENRYPVVSLDLGLTYYWKVNEVNTAEPVASWQGDVWSFTTQNSYVVDNFESYNDKDTAGTAIFQTWADGFTNGSGSQVGHFPAPYMEWVTVREGLQSMPFYYNNTGSYSYSEGVRTFSTAQDWTRGGAKTLVLYFHGLADNTEGRLYVKINGTKVVYDGLPADLTKTFWIPWAIDLAKVGMDLKQVSTFAIGVDNGGYGTLFIDDIRLYRTAPEVATEEVWVEAEAADSLDGIMRIYSDHPDASGGRYIAAFGNTSSGEPIDGAHPGMATYTVRLSGGTYRIIGRVIAPTANDDSFWIFLDGATTNTTNHASGWIRWSLDLGEAWHDVPVRSMDNPDTNLTVLFTVEPGLYNLQITYREDGALLDAWRITKQLQ